MKYKLLLGFSIWFITLPVLALPIARIPQPETQQVLEALEARIHRSLNFEERNLLAKAVREQTPALLQEVAMQSPSKTVLCFGFKISAGWSQLSAGCVHIPTVKTYSVDMLGIGYSAGVFASPFLLNVSFDSSRYDESFDPIPGRYGAGSYGGSFGGGLFRLYGDSGNKQLRATGVAFGFQLDFGTLSFVVIEP